MEYPGDPGQLMAAVASDSLTLRAAALDCLLSLEHLFTSLREVAWAFWRVICSTFTLIFLWARWLWPIVGPALRQTWLFLRWSGAEAFDLIQQFPRSIQLCLLSISLLAFFLYSLHRRGVFARWRSSLLRMRSQGQARLHAAVKSVKQIVGRCVRLALEALTTVGPTLLVFIPLRLYLSASTFRTFQTALLFVLPLWSSGRALLFYYARRKEQQRQSELVAVADSVSPSGGLLKSFKDAADRVFGRPSSMNEELETVKNRLTSGGGRHSIGVPALPSPKSQEVSAVNHRVFAWLDYFVVCAVFDLLYGITLALLRGSIGRGRVSITGNKFGNLYQIYDDYGTPVGSGISAAIVSCLALLYDAFYFSLLTLVLSHKTKYLHRTRRALTAFSFKIITLLTGYQIVKTRRSSFAASEKSGNQTSAKSLRVPRGSRSAFPGSSLFNSSKSYESLNDCEEDEFRSVSESAAAEPVGLIWIVWALIQPHIPKSVVWLVQLLSHVPQIIALMLPSFVMPVAKFIVGSAVPIMGSLQALELHADSRAAYWLTFFVLQAGVETLLMQFIRASLIWRFIPFRPKLECLLLTALQVACLAAEPIAAKIRHFLSLEDPEDSGPLRASLKTGASELSPDASRLRSEMPESGARLGGHFGHAGSRTSLHTAGSNWRNSDDGDSLPTAEEKHRDLGRRGREVERWQGLGQSTHLEELSRSDSFGTDAVSTAEQTDRRLTEGLLDKKRKRPLVPLAPLYQQDVYDEHPINERAKHRRSQSGRVSNHHHRTTSSSAAGGSRLSSLDDTADDFGDANDSLLSKSFMPDATIKEIKRRSISASQGLSRHGLHSHSHTAHDGSHHRHYHPKVSAGDDPLRMEEEEESEGSQLIRDGGDCSQATVSSDAGRGGAIYGNSNYGNSTSGVDSYPSKVKSIRTEGEGQASSATEYSQRQHVGNSRRARKQLSEEQQVGEDGSKSKASAAAIAGRHRSKMSNTVPTAAEDEQPLPRPSRSSTRGDKVSQSDSKIAVSETSNGRNSQRGSSRTAQSNSDNNIGSSDNHSSFNQSTPADVPIPSSTVNSNSVSRPTRRVRASITSSQKEEEVLPPSLTTTPSTRRLSSIQSDDKRATSTRRQKGSSKR